MCTKRRRKKKAADKINIISSTGDFERGAWPKNFSYSDLISATDNFSNEKKLGQGDLGGVYAGFLKTFKLEVAVKKAFKRSKLARKEYTTKIRIICQLRHRNLVQLIGWCDHRGEILLVYELMPQGSLDMHLFGSKSPLIFVVRYKIALGLASALLYLHEGWEQCVVHCDVKSSNVMLDMNFNAKLGDLGVTRLMDHEIDSETTVSPGSLGYVAPEYICSGKATKESDVYSFGVVALEIVSGRKSLGTIEDEGEMSLLDWVWKFHGKGQLLDAIDRSLNLEIDPKHMECLIVVGLWCAHPDYSMRPTIKQAIQVLNFEVPLPKLNSTTLPIRGNLSACSYDPSVSYGSLEFGR